MLTLNKGMKRIIRFFVVCLALSVFQTGVVFGADTQKTQSKRGSATTVTTTKTSSRSSGTTKQQNTNVSQDKEADRTNAISRSTKTAVKTRATATTAIKNQVVKQREKSQPAKKVSTVSRAAASAHITGEANKLSKKTTSARTATKKQAVSRATRTQAILNNDKIANIKAKNYTQCKTVFYDCMDEFCANKDTNLRRCSCSSRIHEFDGIKKQLAEAEDKMLDFNQRLLTVSLSKEDAASINKATEGELGFNTKDKTESEKLLQKITDTLNGSSDSKFNNEMSSLSLDLDTDSAWDTVDSTSGIATTSKNGVDLYNAATPVCIEMAKEVCSDSELEIVQGNYKLAIQQDCNTVAKSYAAQYNQAINKINESGALLDMARLNTYQQQNSDDILTCRKKILAQLNDDSVCGKDLYKCLDTTGQYIDPSTGEAFLSENLYNITTLLTTPSGKETWSGMKQNEKFVAFLNSKKVYLETATEQCKTMANVVWKDFLNDALGKIKLAQNAKLEEIRQSCTTLVAECKDNANQNLADFDARALSTFSVIADTTVNALCEDVQTSCSKLMARSGGGDEFWKLGMEEIAQDTTFDKIIETCSTVGKDCIVQQCNGTSGNFALCEKYSDQPRRAILTKQACWNEIKSCVKQAIITDPNRFNLTRPYDTSSYKKYCEEKEGLAPGSDEYAECIKSVSYYKYCEEKEGLTPGSDEYIACGITEYIWGNCEHNEETPLVSFEITEENKGKYENSNMILTPSSGETLLSWLAYNTGTTSSIDSCSAYMCPVGFSFKRNRCVKYFDGDPTTVIGVPEEGIETEDEIVSIVQVTGGLQNYCPGGDDNKDTWGNCCFENGVIRSVTTENNNIVNLCLPSTHQFALYVTTMKCKQTASYYCSTSDLSSKLFCIITDDSSETISQLDVAGDTLYCPGKFMMVTDYGDYYVPLHHLSTSFVTMFFFYATEQACEYRYVPEDSKWKYFKEGTSDQCTRDNIGHYLPSQNSTHLLIKYDLSRI